ncbi:MAG TPA: hypothetical protein DCQ93_05220 [Bacteroidetes bacterium]|nr:hypothetical protein [Bacteroidota bacterium]
MHGGFLSSITDTTYYGDSQISYAISDSLIHYSLNNQYTTYPSITLSIDDSFSSNFKMGLTDSGKIFGETPFKSGEFVSIDSFVYLDQNFQSSHWWNDSIIGKRY